MRSVYFLAGSLAALICSAQVSAQVPPPPPPPEGGVGQDTFLSARSAGQQRRAQAIAAAGKGENLTGLRAVLRASMKPRPWSLKVSDASVTQLADQDSEAVAQLLATLGYTPRDVAPGNKDGGSLIESAIRVALGRSQLADQVRVSPVVVVGELTGVTPDSSLDDGYASTATFRIVESIKSESSVGSTIRVRQRSGPLPDGTGLLVQNEFQLDQTGRYVLFLSPATYAVRAAHGRSQAPQTEGAYLARVMLPYTVTGQNLVPVAPEQGDASSLTALRSANR